MWEQLGYNKILDLYQYFSNFIIIIFKIKKYGRYSYDEHREYYELPVDYALW